MPTSRDRSQDFARREARARERGYASYRAERNARAAAKRGDTSKLSRYDRAARHLGGGKIERQTPKRAAQVRRVTKPKPRGPKIREGGVYSIFIADPADLGETIEVAAAAGLRVMVRATIALRGGGFRTITAKGPRPAGGGLGGELAGDITVTVGPNIDGARGDAWLDVIEDGYDDDWAAWFQDWLDGGYRQRKWGGS